jgi:hypothetical protein
VFEFHTARSSAGELVIEGQNTLPEIRQWFRERGLKYLKHYEWGWRREDPRDYKSDIVMYVQFYNNDVAAMEFKLMFYG